MGLNRFVLYFTAGDGYTYSVDKALPFHYESGEQALVDFEDKAKFAKQVHAQTFKFAGMLMDTCTFFDEGVYYAPDVLTVDEWFDQLGGDN
jgi:uncharacterized protein YfeS